MKIRAGNKEKAPPSFGEPEAIISGAGPEMEAVPRGTVEEYIQSLVASPRMAGEVVYHKTMPKIPPRIAPPSESRNVGMDDLLSALGINGLYTHQANGIAAVNAGQGVVVATPTASGKTLIYTLPVLGKLRTDPSAKALYIFPLKALAQDQLRAFSEVAQAAGMQETMTGAIYDGDTTSHTRKKIRNNPPAVVMTNPDMMHLSILPYHDAWRIFFERLVFVVIDEIHTYRGVMGSHMAHVFRRFRRICHHYGSDPVFVASSATIGNPGELCHQLTGVPVSTIDASGAPRGKRHIVFMNPMAGPVSTAIQLLKAALHRGLRTIVYAQSRKLTELIAIWAEQSGKFADVISAYRAGFLPSERRDIEAKLSSGELLAVISTSALELGIDIGDLDLCILVGYPGSVMATWQRAGRVGRGGQDSAMILVAGEDALDQYFMNNPAEFMNRPPESAVINPENRNILEKHLVCAAAEQPIHVDEAFIAAAAVQDAVTGLEQNGDLLRSADGKMLYAQRKAPHRTVDLRGAGNRFNIICSETEEHIGDIDGIRVFRDAHPGAVYLHHSRAHVVQSIDTDQMCINVVPKKVNYYTKTRSEKDTVILAVYEERRLAGVTVCTGRLRVTETVTGYEKWRLHGKRQMNFIPLEMPPLVFETEGIWFNIPMSVRDEAEYEYRHFMGGIHAVEHAIIGVLPFFVLCDRNDLGGISMPFHPRTQNPAVFVYDAVSGGIGLARQAYQQAETLLAFTRKMIIRCPCKTGCPSCVHSPKCGSGNRPIDKSCAVFVLDKMLDRRNIDEVPALKAMVNASARSAAGTTASTDPKPAATSCASTAVRGNGDIRYGVFDIETQRSAKEVGGWHRADLMGISCVVLYDSATDQYHSYLEDQVADFLARLAELDLVIGFNNKRFDNRVLAGYSGFDVAALPTLDLLEEAHKTLGYRLSLDNLAGATLRAKKTADGLQALLWWKQGRIDDIIKYCEKDVALTRDLYLYGKTNGYLLFTNKAKQKVRLPVEW
ncbi:MAG: DEAD/DEAH box helicase [Thermodesulfobacteriota bacterium]|nr:DEAD/DEAH box helicase [Thermodesulfobacteriota bacterium]